MKKNEIHLKKKIDATGNQYVRWNKPDSDKYYIFSYNQNLDLKMSIYSQNNRGHEVVRGASKGRVEMREGVWMW